MINTLDIGKYIYSKLSGNDDLVSLLGGTKIYPLIADNDVKFPFIVYRRSNLVSMGCKDGMYEDHVLVEVTVVSDKYSKSIEIVNKIRELIEVQYSSFDDMEICDTTIEAASEDYTDNSYVQRVTFNLKINN